MHSFQIKTFGCKTNQYEEQGIREGLLAAGWVEVARAADAEVLILNTCTVTGQASNHCRRVTGQALRENPALRLVLTGCAADAADEWLGDYRFELILPNARKAELAALLAHAPQKAAAGSSTPDLTAEAASHFAPPSDHSGESAGFGFSLQRFTGHTRAFLKVQDGCANCCSYCIIPAVRGTPRSRPLAAVLQEARQLLEHGYTELVLTGINIGEYRSADTRLPGLAGLALALAQLPGLHRLRLGSVEPQTVTSELLQVMRGEAAICPHLHLPLQSGDDAILRSMNRRYTTSEFLNTLEAVRAALLLPALTTDLIVGYPGEDDASFARTRSLVEQAGFSRGHIFIFSPRQGTPAEQLHRLSPCPRKTAETRHRALSEVCAESARRYAASLAGVEEILMPERKTAEGWSGYCGRYLRTVVPGECALQRGKPASVRILQQAGDGLLAECLEP